MLLRNCTLIDTCTGHYFLYDVWCIHECVKYGDNEVGGTAWVCRKVRSGVGYGGCLKTLHTPLVLCVCVAPTNETTMAGGYRYI